MYIIAVYIIIYIYKVRILLSRAPYIAHCSLRRAHTARAAVPGLRPSQRRPSAGSPALRRAPSAGQCRPSAGHSVLQCRPSASEWAPVPSGALWHCLHHGFRSHSRLVYGAFDFKVDSFERALMSSANFLYSPAANTSTVIVSSLNPAWGCVWLLGADIWHRCLDPALVLVCDCDRF